MCYSWWPLFTYLLAAAGLWLPGAARAAEERCFAAAAAAAAPSAATPAAATATAATTAAGTRSSRNVHRIPNRGRRLRPAAELLSPSRPAGAAAAAATTTTAVAAALQ